MHDYRIKSSPEEFLVRERAGYSLEESGAYMVFEMKKTNYTTEDAVSQIAKALKTTIEELFIFD